MYASLMWGHGRPSKLARWLRDPFARWLRVDQLADDLAATRRQLHGRLDFTTQTLTHRYATLETVEELRQRLEGLQVCLDATSRSLGELERHYVKRGRTVVELDARLRVAEETQEDLALAIRPVQRLREAVRLEQEEAAALRAWVAEMTERINTLEEPHDPEQGEDPEDRDPRCPSWSASHDGKGPYRCCQREGHGRSHLAWQEDGARLRWVGMVSREEARAVEDQRASREPEWRS